MNLLTTKGKCPGKGTSGEWEVPVVGGWGGDRDLRDLARSMVQLKWEGGKGTETPQSGREGSRGGVVTRHA